MTASRSLPSRLRLAEYYAIEGINAVAAPLFFCCLMFWTRRTYGYTDIENLLLVSVSGAVYIVCAWFGGTLTDRIGCDRMLAMSQLTSAACLAVGWMPSWRFTPFAIVIVYTACTATTWPALEAVTQHAPSRLNMPQRTGVYNIVWSCCCIVAFLLGGALYRWRPVAAFIVPSVLHVVEACWVMRPRRGRSPRMMLPADTPHTGESVARPTKERFVKMAWTANSIAYFMANALAGLMPAVGLRLELAPASTIWLFCAMQTARAGGFVLFWHWERWHYHRGWCVVAAAAAPVCLAGVFFAPNIWLVLCAQMVLGLSYALSYAGSLYYSLDMGGQKAAHSGMHEAIIGLGLLLGPLAGVTGGAVFGGTSAAQMTVVVVAASLTVAGMAWASRKARSHGETLH